MLRGSRRMDMGMNHVSCYTQLYANNKIVFTMIFESGLSSSAPTGGVGGFLISRWGEFLVSRWVGFLVSRWVGFLISRWVKFLVSRWVGFLISSWVEFPINRWLGSSSAGFFRRVESLQMHSVHSFHNL